MLIRSSQKSAVKDVNVLGSSMKFSTDHRMVRMTFKLHVEKIFRHPESAKIYVTQDVKMVDKFNLDFDSMLSLSPPYKLPTYITLL